MFMLGLRCQRSLVRFARGRLFFGGRMRGDSTFAAVKRDMGLVVHHGMRVDVGHVDRIHTNHGGVVEENSAAPLAAVEAGAAIALAAVNASPKSTPPAPPPPMPRVETGAPSPVARRP